MNDEEKALFSQLRERGIPIENPTWEACRSWLNEKEWKINVLSDYPRGEIKFTIRNGFERIELSGRSDLEVMAKAILEITRRAQLHSRD